jgi:sterol desaturase/sphingolipid hydroxylase (fatty acid hydroxylase superfamily)
MFSFSLLVLACAVVLFMVLAERIVPATKLPFVSGWWARATFANFSQVAIILLVGLVWNTWLRGFSLCHAAGWPDFVAIPVTYFLSTFLFYWWHRLRHESSLWWRLAHQIHHSASRLELLTTFYKHPLEIGLDSILGATLVYFVMGCSPMQGAAYTVLVALGEMFYHWNIHTPPWLGKFFQRPESHRIHHQRARHSRNYSELPLWDYLFGTYANPKNADRVQCGFADQRETHLVPLLQGRPVDMQRASEPLDLRPACFGCRRRHLCLHSGGEK